MLVLSRKPGERLIIGDDIVVTVLETSGKLVRIGVDAPRHIPVHRAEIREQIEAQNRMAAMKTGYFDRLKDLGSRIKSKK